MIEWVVPILLTMAPQPHKYGLTVVLADKLPHETSYSDILDSQWHSKNAAWQRYAAPMKQDINARFDVRFVNRMDAPCRCESYPAFVIGHEKPFYHDGGEVLPKLHDRLMVEFDERETLRLAKDFRFDSSGGWFAGTWNEDGTPLDLHYQEAVSIDTRKSDEFPVEATVPQKDEE